MRILRQARWSPYAAGAIIGVLSWAAFALADQPLGISSAFVQAVGLAEKAVAPEHTAGLPAFKSSPPKIGWEWTLIAGVLIGAWISARLGGTRDVERVPERWARRFGPNPALRAGAAFAGGLLLLLGARIAGGCTSGHAISGGLQFAVSSWTFLASFFAAGAVAAALLYRTGERHG
jgi:uncharacterized membrane protein YedE/YeeE